MRSDGPETSAHRRVLRQRHACEVRKRVEGEIELLPGGSAVVVRDDVALADALVAEWERLIDVVPVRRRTAAEQGDLAPLLSTALQPTPEAPLVLVLGGETVVGVLLVHEAPSNDLLDWVARWENSGGLLVSDDRSTYCLIAWEADEAVYEVQSVGTGEDGRVTPGPRGVMTAVDAGLGGDATRESGRRRFRWTGMR